MDCGGGKTAFFQLLLLAAGEFRRDLCSHGLAAVSSRLETGLSNRAGTAAALVWSLRWLSRMVNPGLAPGGRHDRVLFRREARVLGGDQWAAFCPQRRRPARDLGRG